jgi:hypothetical protein
MSATIFQCFSPASEPIAQGPIRGSGGMLGYAMAHCSAKDRDAESLRILLAVQRVYARKGSQNRVYEPAPGHVAVYPDYDAAGDGEPVLVPLTGTRLTIANP